MLTIGDFARLVGVSVRMLRHYDRLGLLPPAYVDPHTGYRSYTAGQLDRANRLVAFKELGFALDQVGPLLDELVDDEELRALLHTRRDELVHQIDADRRRLEQVEARLRLIEKEKTMSYPISESALPTLHLAQLTETVTDNEQVPARIGQMFAGIDERVRAAGVAAAGPWSVGHYTAVGDELQIAAAIPVAEGTEVAGAEYAVLPAAERAVTLRMTGPEADFPAAWQELTRAIAERGLSPEGTCREVYHETPFDEGGTRWDVELQQPVV